MSMLVTVLMGSLGACLRFYISQHTLWSRVKNFPYATLTINIIGSALLGALWGLYEEQLVAALVWQWLGVGFLGAFTTFSTFSYEFIQLTQQKRLGAALIYVLLTIVFGVIAAATCRAIITELP